MLLKLKVRDDSLQQVTLSKIWTRTQLYESQPDRAVIVFKIDPAKLKLVQRAQLISDSREELAICTTQTCCFPTQDAIANSRRAFTGIDCKPLHPFFARERNLSITYSNGSSHKAMQRRELLDKDHKHRGPDLYVGNIGNELDCVEAPIFGTMVVCPGNSLDLICLQPLIWPKTKMISNCDEAFGSAWWLKTSHGLIHPSSRTDSLHAFSSTDSPPLRQEFGMIAANSVTGRRDMGMIQKSETSKSRSTGDVLWTDMYAPHTAEQVLESAQANKLKQWLESEDYSPNSLDDGHMKGKCTISSTRKLEDHTGADETDDFYSSKFAILSGPSGSGKSASIYAVAKELNYEIFELHPGTKRAGRNVLDAVGEMSQSHLVNKKRSAGNKKARSIILLEEVDIIFHEDKDFWSIVFALIRQTKRSIVLTCNDLHHVPLQLRSKAFLLEFDTPKFALSTQHLINMAAAEGWHVPSDRILELMSYRNGDLRALILEMQFLLTTDTSIVASNDGGSSLCWEGKIQGDSCRLVLPSLTADVLEAEKRRGIQLGSHTLQKVENRAKSLSTADFLTSRTPSQFFVFPCVYESEDPDNFLARKPARDDILGSQMLSEPGGRYTPHQAGDLNIFAEIFEQLNEGLFKPPEANHLSTSFNFAVKHEAPFLCCASPPDCTYEILSYNSITRSRRILWCEVAPYVRAIARIEALHYQLNVQSVDERVSKRRTRTTLAAARGDTVMRKEAKILENNIQSILDTWISP